MTQTLTEIVGAKTPLKRNNNYHFGKCPLCRKGLCKIWNDLFECSNCQLRSITKDEYLEREKQVYEEFGEDVPMIQRMRPEPTEWR